jgi:NTE family protein
LWICAQRHRDLQRVVFGRDARPPLGSAIVASCSVPGVFSPVAIGGDLFVDGGVRSPTNADIVARAALDIVIVISPMSGRHLPRLGVEPAVRRYAGRRVERELVMVRSHGAATALLQPGRAAARVLGVDFMREDKVSEIVSAAFFDAGEQLQSSALRSALAGVGTRWPGAGPPTAIRIETR